MLTLTDYAVGKLLDKGFGNVDFTPPATFYLGLRLSGTELVIGTGGYARKAVTNNATNFPGASSRISLLAVAHSFAAATLDWGAVNEIILADASTAGNNWLAGPLADLPVLALGATDDTLTSTSHGLTDGQAVRVAAPAGCSLPTGISANTTYYVRDATTHTFKLAATAGGTAIDMTAVGAAWVSLWYGKTISATDVFTVPANALKIKLTDGT